MPSHLLVLQIYFLNLIPHLTEDHEMAPTLDLKNIQGDILLDGLPKRAESFFFFQIADGRVKDFCRSLKQVANEISHVGNTSQLRRDIDEHKATTQDGSLVEMAGANISFSWKGLQEARYSVCRQGQSD